MKNTLFRRAGLVAGVSVTALCTAMPAIGQTTPGIEEILVGDAPDGVVLAGEILLAPDAERVLGTRNEAGTHVTARVDTAIGANPGAINQQVTATSGNAQATITHEGATQIRAIAIGGVMGEDSSSASANSFVTFGANQLATSDNAATVQFSNAEESVVEVLSLAEARATLSANASATLDAGIRQSAMAEDVALEISNAGTMEFNAEALAEGGTGANATARSERGLWQRVEDQPDATLSIDNAAGGLIASNTAASAATQNGTASATADSRRIIQQEVRGNYFGGEDMGRNAAISLNNAGDIVAIAEADASSVMGNANTNVYQEYVVLQNIRNAENGTISLTNAAGANIIGNVSASADSENSNAYAYSYSNYAVLQENFHDYWYYGYSNFNRGIGISDLVNEGTIALMASSEATGSGSNIQAQSNTYAAIAQYTYYHDENINTASNLAGGLISTSANSVATSDNRAEAYAYSGNAVDQYAYGLYYYYSNQDMAALASNQMSNAGQILRSASALAEGRNRAYSQASARAAVRQGGYYASEVSNTFTNAATGVLEATSTSTARSEEGSAVAYAYGEDSIYQYAVGTDYWYSYYYGGEDMAATISNSVTNAGAITQTSTALAEGESAEANSNTGSAVRQYGYHAEDITNSLNNAAGAAIIQTATAEANATSGPAEARANAWRSIDQYASNYDYWSSFDHSNIGQSAQLDLQNAGTISTTLAAEANSVDGRARARSEFGTGIDQRSEGKTLKHELTLANAGTGAINFNANSMATSLDGDAVAQATMNNGINQRAESYGYYGDLTDTSANLAISNAAGGTITLGTMATANATGGEASANSGVDHGINQNAATQQSNIALSNAGSILIASTSTAMSTAREEAALPEASVMVMLGEDAPMVLGSAEANSFIGAGVQQQAFGSTASLTNTGTIGLDVQADATAADIAFSGAFAQGVAQSAFGESAAVSFTNGAGSTLSVATSATSSGAVAISEAGAAGVIQNAAAFGLDESAAVSFSNAGSFTISSAANADGSDAASAYAGALGYEAAGSGVDLTFGNAGTFTVSAMATSTGQALAEAAAIELGGASGGMAPKVMGPEPTGLNAAITNSGTMNVTASATGGSAGLANRVVPSDMTDAAAARAAGIIVNGPISGLTITNSGTINVAAITNGGAVETAGIGLFAGEMMAPMVPFGEDMSPPPAPPPPPRATIANAGGTIIARHSVDNGATFTHGTAINTRESAAAVDMVFTGNSRIYGNIVMGGDDTITIQSGTTRFDGVINPLVSEPEMGPVTGMIPRSAMISAISTEGPVFSDALALGPNPPGPLLGSLAINSGATLFLEDNPHNNPNYSGPAQANVDTFTIASGGTLALQLPTSTNAFAAQSAYPQINADTANLGGTLQIVLNTPNGLFGDNYVFDNIITANTRNGQFANVVTSTGSALLTPTASYDGDSNVDLRVSRVGFGAVNGLTFNQTASGNGIEAVYTPTQGGAFGEMLANLFLQTPETYAGALDQISGDQYAGFIQNLRNNSLQISTLIADQTDCAINKEGWRGCTDRTQGVRLWAIGMNNDAGVDSDVNAPGYDANNWHVLMGVDYTTGGFTIGGFGGYRSARANFDRNNGRIEADGFQLGMLASYDIGTFYLRGNLSYSDLNGTSTRGVNLLSTAGTITGDPDFRIVSAYGEAGARIAVGETWLTPFAAVEHTDVRMSAFTEAGVPGANLDFARQSQNQTSFLAGVKWAANLGGVIPEAKVAYRHDGGDPFFTTTQSFADGPAGSAFTVRSPMLDRDTVMAGFSLAGAFTDRIVGRVGYQGRFGSNLRDNAIFGGLSIRLGGARQAMPEPVAPPAPPPPPPPPAPVAPPAPEPAACNTGPYIVFFDFDSSAITAEAAMVLNGAVTAYQNCGTANVMLAGHTDTAGPAQYNMALAGRRNASVRDYMTGQGIPADRISSEAFGQTRLRVPTADGVREPQNRRVEITYGPGSGM